MNNVKGYFLVFLVTILNAIGQYLLKLGSSNLVFNFTIFQNYSLFLGMFLYGISAILLIYALKFGDLNVLYPIISLTFIWVTILSVILLKETINILQLTGITFILFGVFIISKGGKK